MELIHLNETPIVEALHSKDGFAFELYCKDINMHVANFSPSISALRQNTSDGNIVKTLYHALTKKLKSFGERGNITEDEVRAIAIDFFNLRQSMSMEDMMLCLDYGRQGKFGKVFGKVDAVTINEWVMKYADMKAEFMEQKHNEQKNKPIMNADIANRLLNDLNQNKDEGKD